MREGGSEGGERERGREGERERERDRESVSVCVCVCVGVEVRPKCFKRCPWPSLNKPRRGVYTCMHAKL